MKRGQPRLCSSSGEDESVLAADCAVAVMAFPGKTVGPAAAHVDFQSCVFLWVVQWARQGVLAFMASALSISDWMDVICFSYFNRILSLPLRETPL